MPAGRQPEAPRPGEDRQEQKQALAEGRDVRPAEAGRAAVFLAGVVPAWPRAGQADREIDGLPPWPR